MGSGGRPQPPPEAARRPAETVSQPSKGQVVVPTVFTDIDPSALRPASAHRLGVACGSTSSQWSPGTPMNATRPEAWASAEAAAGDPTHTADSTNTSKAHLTGCPPAARHGKRIEIGMDIGMSTGVETGLVDRLPRASTGLSGCASTERPLTDHL